MRINAIPITAVTGATLDRERNLRFVRLRDGNGGEFALALTDDLLGQLIGQCLGLAGRELDVPDGDGLMVLPAEGVLGLKSVEPGRAILAVDLASGLRLAFDLPAEDARQAGDQLLKAAGQR